ncbi:MAG: hypothetical protein KGI38_11980 [Thaumarchaeota archaeon]|nr:hypothetical protein [Nitrososphaerota archaeon]
MRIEWDDRVDDLEAPIDLRTSEERMAEDEAVERGIETIEALMKREKARQEERKATEKQRLESGQKENELATL